MNWARHDRRLPIVEANSQRVLCRIYGVAQNPKAPAVQRMLWQYAESLLPTKSVGDFNQALMELGALVCTPTAPDCEKCPLRANCAAKRSGLQERIPPKKAEVLTNPLGWLVPISEKCSGVVNGTVSDNGRETAI